MDGYRLEAYMAVREMAGRYPDIVAAMRISLKSELDWTRCLDFLLSAAEEFKRCLERGDQFRIDDIVAQFGDVATFFDEDITNKIYTERRLIQFVVDFGIALGIIFDQAERPQDIKQKSKEKVMDKKEQEEQLKALSRAIMEAVTNDAKVMAMLQDLKKRGIVDSSTLLGLALRIGEIVEISGMAFRQDELGEQNVPPSAEPAKPEVSAVVPPAHELIDGRELSAKEAEFQAWSAEQFDERAWLKNMGLIF